MAQKAAGGNPGATKKAADTDGKTSRKSGKGGGGKGGGGRGG